MLEFLHVYDNSTATQEQCLGSVHYRTTDMSQGVRVIVARCIGNSYLYRYGQSVLFVTQVNR